ncbi:MAG: hypothetical protein L0Y37_00120 [Bacteroidales bacterium]|nr:hypothetical protein [Bacteroidales bacterium]
MPLRDDAPSELSAPVGAFSGYHIYFHSYSPQGRQVNNRGRPSPKALASNGGGTSGMR